MDGASVDVQTIDEADLVANRIEQEWFATGSPLFLFATAMGARRTQPGAISAMWQSGDWFYSTRPLIGGPVLQRARLGTDPLGPEETLLTAEAIVSVVPTATATFAQVRSAGTGASIRP